MADGQSHTGTMLGRCHRTWQGPGVIKASGERPHPNPLPEGEGTLQSFWPFRRCVLTTGLEKLLFIVGILGHYNAQLERTNDRLPYTLTMAASVAASRSNTGSSPAGRLRLVGHQSAGADRHHSGSRRDAHPRDHRSCPKPAHGGCPDRSRCRTYGSSGCYATSGNVNGKAGRRTGHHVSRLGLRGACGVE